VCRVLRERVRCLLVEVPRYGVGYRGTSLIRNTPP